MSWIRLENGYHRNSKVLDFAEAIGERTAGYYLTVLWGWVVESHHDGDLSGVSDQRIADMADYRGDAKTFCRALRKLGFLDPDGYIHNWEHWQGSFIRKRESDRQSAADRRSKIKGLPDSRTTVAPTVDATDARPTSDKRATDDRVSHGRTNVRTNERTNEEKTEEQVPVPPVGSTPSQVALIPEPPPVATSKRAAKAKPPDDPQKRLDADAWFDAYKAGVPEADRVPLTRPFWVQWSALRKRVGIEAMLRSLKGILSLPRDKFPRNADPVVWVTHGYANGISATSTAPIASAGQRGAFPTPGVGSVREERAYSKPVEAFRVEWSAENELARIAAMGRWSKSRTVNVPWDKEWPESLAIPEGYTINRLPKPEPVARLQDLIGAPLE